ncbi:zinc-dependent metalloprotease [Corynebacterium sp. 153RC1]|uniref:zinc-dependent metalloprotease n=1 Tax=unclassified Corynebacterium TaxID=2624378 RepID=UPI00211CA606|nr:MULTISPECIES: zinc-dependent metalloprotease [unclassified Corynebacterium]MCQ9371214.1 zinc-dependent metalloprotease [Corynebacterium sp. 35RC1]MCQ9352088.1 zinc-dependent metalloprotease [Corynebacterium sp. 209RC1]MCQ9354090.1 zinc-dependent metalloprotease [Corynebacterium sp. 1222RC1]MCQ9356370.1 zinc-dependent metalloprotease [Corynebacterium sp. 122RC1]MCQ9358472.1 zinc-dependent metalloprotease [Corynebacterium sp. 142RC1]
MNSNGFGFSFQFGGDDDDANNRNNQNPFGFGGGLGDILGQFGQMMSGLSEAMNSSDPSEPVNYAVASRMAKQMIGQPKKISDQERTAVEESVRLVELWLDDATILPASGNQVQAWNQLEWLDNTLAGWKRFISPMAEQTQQAQLNAMPSEQAEMMGPMAGAMQQMASMNYAMQLSGRLGELSSHALSGSDFGIDVAPSGVTALLPHNLEEATKELDVPAQEVLVFLAAREAARQRLFRHVPWLKERMVASVEEYAQGLELDTSAIDEVMRTLESAQGDPHAMQEAMESLQGIDMNSMLVSRNTGAKNRLATLLALIEGWAELVVAEALGERMPHTKELEQAWRRRRTSGGSAQSAFAQVTGVIMEDIAVDEARELWRRVGIAVGTERRDRVWDHPDFMPTADDVANSAEFIDSLLDSAEGTDTFDPIAEIAKLEAMLEENSGKGNENNGGDSDEGEAPETESDPESDSGSQDEQK